MYSLNQSSAKIVDDRDIYLYHQSICNIMSLRLI